MNNVQAFVTNMSVPKTLEDLFYHVEEYGGYVLDRLLEEWGGTTSWTVPRWAKAGDIVFFMHAKSSAQYLRKLAKLLEANKDHYTQEQYDNGKKVR